MLKTEWDHYQDKRDDWLRECPGRYVLVKDQERVGVFDSFYEAVEAGYDRLGNVPFLVRRVGPEREGGHGSHPDR